MATRCDVYSCSFVRRLIISDILFPSLKRRLRYKHGSLGNFQTGSIELGLPGLTEGPSVASGNALIREQPG